MYKLISIDLDDTLLNNNHIISQGNLDAITKAQDKGIKIIICTGRPTRSALRIVNEIGIFKDDDYVISYNGAVITTVKGNVIHEFKVTNSKLVELIELGRESKIDIQCYSIDDFIVEKNTVRTTSYENLTKMKALMVKDLKVLEFSYKVLFNGRNVEELESLQVKIDSKFSDKLASFFSKPTFLEIVDKECNKGFATKIVADIFSIKKEEVISIGDSLNDIPMIEFAGLGACVKNGRDAVKEKANYICDKTNHEDAVAEVIEKFIL